MPGQVTKDIGVAAWITMHRDACRIRLVKVDRDGPNSEFVFSDPDDEWDTVSAGFPGSEAHIFDASVRALKSLGYSKKRAAR